MEKRKTIIMLGNINDGYEFMGPFPDFDAATLYDEDHNGGHGYIVSLQKPASDEDKTSKPSHELECNALRTAQQFAGIIHAMRATSRDIRLDAIETVLKINKRSIRYLLEMAENLYNGK